MLGKKNMGSKWRKAKLALGLNLCVFVPRTLEDSPPPPSAVDSSERLSDAALLPPVDWDTCHRPMTPTPSSHGLRLSKSGSKSSKVCVLSLISFFILLLLTFLRNDFELGLIGCWEMRFRVFFVGFCVDLISLIAFKLIKFSVWFLKKYLKWNEFKTLAT